MAANIDAVRVPRELTSVRPTVLEEYVRARINQFSEGMLARLAGTFPGGLDINRYRETASDVVARLPPPLAPDMPIEQRELQLVFRHDCMALGCSDPQCVLCTHNTNRRCHVNFDRKYLVNDALRARCTAVIRIELVDRATGAVVDEQLPDLSLQLTVLDGNMYDARFLDNGGRAFEGNEADADLDACALYSNNKGAHLLSGGAGASHDAKGRVVLSLNRGRAPITELHVTDSSEALLSGRKPPFRLLVRALHRDGRRLRVRHAISEGFVVATRRTRTAGKVDIPSVDDHVSKLEHMGKETVKKLQDIRGAARQVGMDINIPENCVLKVGQFKQLAMRAEQDGHLRQKLQHVLKLSKEKWEEARDHAMKAVFPDNQLRVWYANGRSMGVGLMYACRMAIVDLERPVAMVLHNAETGEVEATLAAQQSPAQRETVRQLLPQAAQSWWMPGHPGWAIFPVDTDAFLTQGAGLSSAMPLPHSDAVARAAAVLAAGSSAGGSPMQQQQPQQQRQYAPGGTNFQQPAAAGALPFGMAAPSSCAPMAIDSFAAAGHGHGQQQSMALPSSFGRGAPGDRPVVIPFLPPSVTGPSGLSAARSSLHAVVAMAATAAGAQQHPQIKQGSPPSMAAAGGGDVPNPFMMATQQAVGALVSHGQGGAGGLGGLPKDSSFDLAGITSFQQSMLPSSLVQEGLPLPGGAAGAGNHAHGGGEQPSGAVNSTLLAGGAAATPPGMPNAGAPGAPAGGGGSALQLFASEEINQLLMMEGGEGGLPPAHSAMYNMLFGPRASVGAVGAGGSSMELPREAVMAAMQDFQQQQQQRAAAAATTVAAAGAAAGGTAAAAAGGLQPIDSATLPGIEEALPVKSS